MSIDAARHFWPRFVPPAISSIIDGFRPARLRRPSPSSPIAQALKLTRGALEYHYYCRRAISSSPHDYYAQMPFSRRRRYGTPPREKPIIRRRYACRRRRRFHALTPHDAAASRRIQTSMPPFYHYDDATPLRFRAAPPSRRIRAISGHYWRSPKPAITTVLAPACTPFSRKVRRSRLAFSMAPGKMLFDDGGDANIFMAFSVISSRRCAQLAAELTRLFLPISIFIDTLGRQTQQGQLMMPLGTHADITMSCRGQALSRFLFSARPRQQAAVLPHVYARFVPPRQRLGGQHRVNSSPIFRMLADTSAFCRHNIR